MLTTFAGIQEQGFHKGDLLPGPRFFGWLFLVHVDPHLHWLRYLVSLFRGVEHINASLEISRLGMQKGN